MKPLILRVKKEYFDQIKAGTKIAEYRVVKDYWTKRLEGKEFSEVQIWGGARCAPRTVDNVLHFPWNGYVKAVMSHPLFGKDPMEVYAIRLFKEKS